MNDKLIILAGILLGLALILLRLGARRQRGEGLPVGKVIYADPSLWGRVEKPLYDVESRLAGKPDYLVKQDGAFIPVEVKSTYVPSVPYESHVFQLLAYCLLVESSFGKRPPYGMLVYRNRTFAIDYTVEQESALRDLLVEMRQQERKKEIVRSHSESARCQRCGFRSICDERL